MNLTGYIESIKEQLDGLGDDPAIVVDGPTEFALNTQQARQFISVAETDIGYTPTDSLNVYSAPTEYVVSIYIEKSAADRTARHLARARQIFDAAWQRIGVMKVTAFQCIRSGGTRIMSDNPSAVEFEIRFTLEAKGRDHLC